VEPHIRTAEIERSRQERPRSMAAYDLYLQAVPKLFAESAEDHADADALLSEALALEPNNATFLANAVWALSHRIAMGWTPIGSDDEKKCLALARRGLQHAAGNAHAMAHCGIVLLLIAREYDLGMAAVRSAAEANPNSLMVVVIAGIANIHCGNIEDALAYFQRAIRLSPRDPGAHISLTGIAHVEMILGNYSEALAWATRSLALNAQYDPTYWMLIAANAQLGRTDEARRWLARFRSLAPGITIARIKAGQPAYDPARTAAILEGLRLAGLDEG
jgi:tetratricopeptide (TPR) repeat protein